MKYGSKVVIRGRLYVIETMDVDKSVGALYIIVQVDGSLPIKSLCPKVEYLDGFKEGDEVVVYGELGYYHHFSESGLCVRMTKKLEKVKEDGV